MSTNQSTTIPADLAKVVARWASVTDHSTFVKAAKAEAREYLSHNEKGFARVVGAAYATQAAYAAGEVGKGKFYADTQAIADAFGLASKGNVTKWRMLGRVLLVGKIDPSTDLYRSIQTGNLHAGTAVKAVINSDAFDADMLAEAIAKDAKDKDTKAKKGAQATAAEKKAAKDEAEAKVYADAVADMTAHARVKLIKEMIDLLAASLDCQPKHLATVGADLRAAIARREAAVTEAKVATPIAS